MKGKIKEIVENISEKPVSDFDSSLCSDLSLESLDFIRIISEVEDEFDINFDDEDFDIDKLDSINKISALVQNKLRQ